MDKEQRGAPNQWYHFCSGPPGPSRAPGHCPPCPRVSNAPEPALPSGIDRPAMGGHYEIVLSESRWDVPHNDWSIADALNVFNDALNTFYFRLYVNIEIVRGNPLPPYHGLLFFD